MITTTTLHHRSLILARNLISHGRIACTSTFPYSSSSNLPLKDDPKLTEVAQFVDEYLPTEKTSLSRGLVLDKFEKDFLIFPEYENTPDYDAIKDYVTTFGEDLESALKNSATELERNTLPVSVIQALAKSNINASFIPKEFGGAGFSEKDRLLIFDKLGANLSVFFTVNQVQTVASLLTSCGTGDQKLKYLPKIASFNYKPAICLRDEPYGESAEMEVVDSRGDGLRLNGVKANVMNANNANLFLVFAKHKLDEKTVIRKCYIVDRTKLKDTEKITIEDQYSMEGLNSCSFSAVRFDNVSISSDDELGIITSSNDLYNDLLLSEKVYYGAAVVGHLKRVLGELCQFSNTSVEGTLRFSDSHSVQAAITNLSVGVYALESMVYYIGGLKDEDLYLVHDIETSIIQRFAIRIMREAINTLIDVAGITAVNKDFSFEKTLRDVIATMSLAEPDLKLVKNITLPAFEAFANQNTNIMNSLKQYTFFNLFTSHNEMDEPKLKYFIAEHVHPSLEIAARQLEHSMTRLNKCIEKLISYDGAHVKVNYLALKDIALVMENNLAILAIISRASRSYSIGLRNCDNEIRWALWFCTRAAKKSETVIREILADDNIGLTLSPSLTHIGQSTLEGNGYYIENPLEKNW